MNRWAFAAIMILSTVLRAHDWAPIPASTWAIKEDSKAGIQGALILDESSRYGINDSEFGLRILVLSEAGKAAVQLDPFPSNIIELDGRTVYPDGRVVEFSKVKDFTEQMVESSRYSSKQKVVIPPGITAHCILDLHWRTNGSYLVWTKQFTRAILRDYPIQHLELKLSKMSPMGSVLLVPSAMKPDVSEDSGYRIYDFKNLPAMVSAPYTRWGLRSWPCLLCFLQPRMLNSYLDQKPEVYWNKAVEYYLKPYYEGIDAGGAYKSFSAEVLKDLPQDPFQKAGLILVRLNERILNTTWMTAAERAARTKHMDGQLIHAQDLAESVKRGWTNGQGMYNLAFQLFKDAGLHPRLMLVTDRDKWSLRYSLKDYYQFDDVLVGISSADGKSVAWLDPAKRFLPLGIVDPSYQGVMGLEVDTNSWVAKPAFMPAGSKESSQERYAYDLTVDDSAIQFKASTAYKGYDDYLARYPYFASDPAEASKALKESWSKNLPAYTITQAEILNAGDRARPVTMKVEGRKDQDGGRRTTFSPFPGMERPWWVPDSWPEHRTDEIVMAYRCIRSADSTIRLPKGWKVSEAPPIHYESKLGSVSWTCAQGHEADGEVLQVHYEVQVDSMFLAPSEIETLKAFLAAMEEGWNRTLTVERSR